MRIRTLILCLAGAAVLAVASLPILLAASGEFTPSLPPDRVSPTEHQQTIEALKPPKRPRPAIAILALNKGTEVSDLFSSYGVLVESGVADVTVVADRADPIRLYPAGSIEPQATTAQFDASHPEGADYVVIPAMEPRDDPAIIAWIKAQHGKGAKIVSICNGSLTMSATGLLEGRRATGHWYSIKQLQTENPTMEYVPDRRYVVDRGIATSTGITSSVPLMIALVEAISGRAEAEKLAVRLGAPDWDARHRSSFFQLNAEHRKTYVRNRLSFWRHETIGIKVAPNVDEMALGFMVDAYSRTELSRLSLMGETDGVVQTRHGLRLRPDTTVATAGADTVLEPQSDTPARSLDSELARIASRYDRPTAAYVALIMEHPWSEQQARLVQD
jgi:putative intracellular protease/amidase